MRFKTIAILFFVFISTNNLAFAQQKPVVKDSTKIYSEIESFSKRGKFTKFMYSLIFKPVAPASHQKKGKKKVYKKADSKAIQHF